MTLIENLPIKIQLMEKMFLMINRVIGR